MDRAYFIGIDAGTSSIKAVLVDLCGNEVGVVETPTEVRSGPDGTSEMDMEVLWQKCCDVLRTLSEQYDLKAVRGIGVAGQGEGLWLLDAQNQPLIPAILWNDSRAAAVTRSWCEDAALAAEIRAVTGSVPFNGATLVLLAWLKKHRPETFARMGTVFWCKDWLRYCLTGALGTDYSDASTSLLDLRRRQWAQGLFSRLELGDVETCLPELMASTDIGGYITQAVAKETGLAPGIPVITGAIDIVATAFGAGARVPGDVCTILGTTCCNEIIVPTFTPDKCSTSGYECFSPGENYIHVTAAMAGTPNIEWVIRGLLTDEERERTDIYHYIEENIHSTEINIGGVIYHPYIHAAGERAPFAHSGAKAQFFGINQNTRRWDLIRAVYEGVAFSIVDCLGEGDGDIYLCGGGASSALWSQIIADVTGRNIHVSAGKEVCARGAALYALLALTERDLSMESHTTYRIFTSDPQRHAIYRDVYQLYRDIRRNLAGCWTQHQKLQQQWQSERKKEREGESYV